MRSWTRMNELILNVHPLVELPQPPTHQPAVYQLRLPRETTLPCTPSPFSRVVLCLTISVSLTSHILVPKAKLGTPAFAGNPPPSDTTSLLMDSTANQKRKRYAEFFVSNFIPWSASRPPVLSYETWKLHVTALEREACLHRNREPDAPDNASHNEMLAIQSAERLQFIAAGRLYDIENLISGFKTTKDSQIQLGKH